MPRKTKADLRRLQNGSQSLPEDVCGASFNAFDGPQSCGRPKGHPGTHTLDPLSYEQAKVSPTSRAREIARKSYAVVGIDSSLTSIAAVAWGYDAKIGKHKVEHGEIRWMPEVDYFARMRDAAKAHELVLDLLHKMWTVDLENVYIAMEEAVHYGAIQRGIAAFAKQQMEVAGALKGSLARYGFPNMEEVNNSSWHKTLRQEGIQFAAIPRGTRGVERERIKLENKYLVKEFAIEFYGLPDLPDLVASKSGAKIPRPESGFGAKAKAVQPNDIFDAAAVLHYHRRELEALGILPA